MDLNVISIVQGMIAVRSVVYLGNRLLNQGIMKKASAHFKQNGVMNLKQEFVIGLPVGGIVFGVIVKVINGCTDTFGYARLDQKIPGLPGHRPAIIDAGVLETPITPQSPRISASAATSAPWRLAWRNSVAKAERGVAGSSRVSGSMVRAKASSGPRSAMKSRVADSLTAKSAR